MARPKRVKLVSGMPAATYYKPQGIPLRELEEVVLPLEGMEALRLVDAEGIPRAEAAALMGISGATLCRVLALARKVVAQALLNGYAIKIDGGCYTFESAEIKPEAAGCRKQNGHNNYKE